MFNKEMLTTYHSRERHQYVPSTQGLLYRKPSYSKLLNNEELEKIIKKINSESVKLILDLSNRGISDNQFFQIISAISEAKNCKSFNLRLSVNKISDKGIEQAALLIQSNTKWLNIELSYNLISEKGANYFLNVLKTNMALVKLNLFHNEIGDETLDELDKLIKRNVGIQNEFRRFNYYLAMAITSRVANFQRDIINLMLDCCVETSIPEVRFYLRKALYPRVIAIANKLTFQEINEISEKIVFQKKQQDETNIIDRLEKTKDQYRNFDETRFLNQKYLGYEELDGQDESELLFSTLNNPIREDLVSNNIRENKKITSFDCCIMM